jgi:anti-anti-sigma factor
VSGEVTVVHVAGELDLSTVATLAEVLEPCLTGDVDVIVLDLSEVSFLGGAALRLFEHADQHTQHRGGTLRFVTGSRRVDRVLGIAESIGSGPFATYPTLEAAISGNPAVVDGCGHRGFPDEAVRADRVPAHGVASRCPGTIGPVSRPVSTTDD